MGRRGRIRGLAGWSGLFLALAAVAFLPSMACPQEQERSSTLVLGMTDNSVVRGERELRPIVTYLAARLQDVGIARGGVFVPRSISTLSEHLRREAVDVVFASPYPAVTYARRAGAEPILLGRRYGLEGYHTHIFVREDSGIRRLEDLRGRVLAFGDRGSTSAYFLPRLSLLARGLRLQEVHSPGEPVPSNTVGYIFAGDKLNIATWVYYGKVQAGALDNAVWDKRGTNPEAYRREFRVIFETESVPQLIVSVRKGLSPERAERIREELLRMHRTPGGRSALMAHGIDDFSPISVELLRPCEELYDRTARAEPP